MVEAKVMELVKTITTDSTAQEKLKDLSLPTDLESIITYCVEAAKRLDFDVTEEQIRATADALNEEQQKATEAAASEVESLSLDDLDAAAGGADNSACSDSFEQRENCVFDDGCDINVNNYDNYDCLHNHRGYHCGFNDQMNCSNALI